MSRILLLVNSLRRGGAERVCVNLVEAWSSQGHSTTLVTWAASESDEYRVNSTVKRIGLKLESPSSGPFQALWNNYRRFRVLRNLFHSESPDVVVGFNSTSNVLILLASRKSRIRTIVSERNYPQFSLRNPAWVLLRKMTYRWASRVVVQTQVAADWIEQQLGVSNVSVIPNMVELPLPSGEPVKKPEDWIDEKQNVILAVGSLNPKKGFDLLLEAYAGLAEYHQHWQLVIVGNGNADLLEAQISELGLDGRVIRVGGVGNLADWYKRSELFVLSSRHEGFPNVLLEAMAHGCCSVSFDCLAGPADIIDPDVNGVLVENGNVVELTRQMKRLIDQESVRITLGRNATGVITRFDKPSVLERWSRVIDNESLTDGVG